MAEKRIDARSAFLTELIDDAGLFPPARLPMQQAVSGHRTRRRSELGWVQHRLLCPASRLEELAALLHRDEPRWRLGVILDGAGGTAAWEHAVEEDLRAVVRVLEQTDGPAHVDAVEVRLPAGDPEGVRSRVDQLAGLLTATPWSSPPVTYVEIDVGGPLDPAMAALAACSAEQPVQLRAKLRCGGVRAGDVPPVEQVTAFMSACQRHGVAFKATAGLHQPLPHDEPVTGDRQYGFLGVLGGAVLLHAGAITQADLPAVLTQTDAGAWRLDADALAWRAHLATGPAVAAAREEFVAGFGSCSLQEPTQRLRELGFLPTAAHA